MLPSDLNLPKSNGGNLLVPLEALASPLGFFKAVPELYKGSRFLASCQQPLHVSQRSKHEIIMHVIEDRSRLETE